MAPSCRLGRAKHTKNVTAGVLSLRGLEVGAGVLVGDAVLELVRLGRQVLLLVRRRRVLGFRRVLRLYVGIVRAVIGRGIGGGNAHNGEKEEALKEGEFVEDKCFFQLGWSPAQRSKRRARYPFIYLHAD